MPTDLLPLSASDLHLWFVAVDPQDLETRKTCFRQLPADEQERCLRFRAEKDQALYAVSHAMLRRVLSRYAAVEPEDWNFGTVANGKPVLDQRHRGIDLAFNLTHTPGMAACVVSRLRDVGVDAEWTGRRTNREALADNCFADPELAHWKSLVEPDRRDTFFDLWTLKEAYIKGVGVGLSVSLKGFWFDGVHTLNPSIHFIESTSDQPRNWSFHRQVLSASHRAAVAARIEPGETLELSQFEYDPHAG